LAKISNLGLVASVALIAAILFRREGRLEQQAITERETFDETDPTVTEAAIAGGSALADAGSTLYNDAVNAINNVGSFLERTLTGQSQDLDTGSSAPYSQADLEADIREAEAEQTTLNRISENLVDGVLPSDYAEGL
jgi:hypothetical protein